MRKQLVDKIRYYNLQSEKAMRDFLKSNTRTDRDRVLRLHSKVDTLKEVLELINE